MRVCGRGSLTGDLVLGVLHALLALAVGSAGLGNVDLGSHSQHSGSMLLKFPISCTGDECEASDRRKRWRGMCGDAEVAIEIILVRCCHHQMPASTLRPTAGFRCGAIPRARDGVRVESPPLQRQDPHMSLRTSSPL